MGTVYEGWDPVIERRLAIKTVQLPQDADDEMQQAIARFRREAQAAGRLTHPNIVGVFDYGETQDLAYIVMEFVDGPALKQLLDKNERFSLPTIARIMEDLLAGLQFSHDRGVVHRDIKPANVMLTKDGQAKIADFGIARIESSSMTQAGTVLGTPAYMSPEQFMGLVVDARTDIYSSGVLLYQLLTGERPFDGSMTAIMHKALNTDPPAPSQLANTVPRAFDSVVHRAMAKRPEDRYSSAAEFMVAIRAAIAASARAPGFDGEATVPMPSRSAAPAVAVASPLSRTPLAGVGTKRLVASPMVVGAGIAGLAVLGGVGYFLLPGTTDKPVSVPEPARLPPLAATSVTAPPVPAATPPVSTAAPPIPASIPSAPAAIPSVPATTTPVPTAAPTAIPQVPAANPPVPAPISPVPNAIRPAPAAFPPVPAATPPAPAPLPPPSQSASLQSPVAPPPAALSPLEQARQEAQSVPCAVLNVADGPRVSGLASAGQGLDRLLAGLRDIGPLTDEIALVDQFACAPITAVAAFVRQSWDSVPPAFVLRPAQREVASGAHLGIDVSTARPILYVDLFQSDGSVRHVARPPRSGAASKPHADFVAGPGAGPALIVAIGSAVALDLGVRPEAERAVDYLAVLRSRLQAAVAPPFADVAMVTVLPAAPIVGKPLPAEPAVGKPRPNEQAIVKPSPQAHSQSLRSGRCANIISRAQLGETLSDDELAALRTECRS